jgi:hypothetical protein
MNWEPRLMGTAANTMRLIDGWERGFMHPIAGWRASWMSSLPLPLVMQLFHEIGFAPGQIAHVVIDVWKTLDE